MICLEKMPSFYGLFGQIFNPQTDEKIFFLISSSEKTPIFIIFLKKCLILMVWLACIGNTYTTVLYVEWHQNRMAGMWET